MTVETTTHSDLRGRGARPSVLSARGLSKSYGRRVAVDSVDLDVGPGSVLGLLGPNGAGKTTLIRMLSTVLPADAGSFSVAGAPHTRPADVRRRIGVLPESAGYPTGQTCVEWLTLHARLFGASRSDARGTAYRLLGEVGLAERRDSLIAHLSRGMRQRLGIARALVNDPVVVFLDEPTLGLDPKGQRQVLDLVTGIARDHGVTVALSTHVLDEVEQICDRVVILHRGRIVADGTVAEVVRRAAAPRAGVLRVPPEQRARTLRVLEDVVGVSSRTGDRPGEVTFDIDAGRDPEEIAATALGRVLAAGAPVLGFTLGGARLSDAFLTVTEEER